MTYDDWKTESPEDERERLRRSFRSKWADCWDDPNFDPDRLLEEKLEREAEDRW